MSNSLRNGFVRLLYSTPQGQHIHTFQCLSDPDTGFGSQSRVVLNNGTIVSAETAILAYATEYRKVLNTAAQIASAEFWSWLPNEPSPIFRHAFSVGLAGTYPGTIIPASQTTVTWRTVLGGIGKTVWLNTAIPLNQRNFPPLYGGTTAVQQFMSYAVSPTSMLRGRDDGYPIAGIKMLTKTNDALRRRYNMV